MEVATPGSITSDVEAGVRIGDVAIALGILNVGDRIVRDHVFSQPSTGDLVNYPGRRWRATLRIRAPR
jgi:hypothetical protein